MQVNLYVTESDKTISIIYYYDGIERMHATYGKKRGPAAITETIVLDTHKFVRIESATTQRKHVTRYYRIPKELRCDVIVEWNAGDYLDAADITEQIDAINGVKSVELLA